MFEKTFIILGVLSKRLMKLKCGSSMKIIFQSFTKSSKGLQIKAIYALSQSTFFLSLFA